MGTNKGTPRVWLEGKWMLRGGFAPGGRIAIEFGDGVVRIELDERGERRVSGKASRTVPVIDIHNGELDRALRSAQKLEVVMRGRVITITPAYVESLVAARKSSRTEIAIFAGGGIMTQAARQAGYRPVAAIELDADFAAVYEANHPEATVYNCSVEQVPFDELRRYAPVGLLTLGIPCEPHSNARKRDRALPNEAHELGDMVFWALRAIEACNPYMVTIENAPAFLASASFYILRTALERLGYRVEGRVINSVDHGALTERKRAVVIATTASTIAWPAERQAASALASVLEPVDACEWFDRDSKPWLFEHWDRHKAKGNGFANSVKTARYDSPKIGTIKKRYFNGQGDNPTIAHPAQPGLYRWLTVREAKRLHGIPECYELGSSKTLAGAVIGQSVVVPVFEAIIAVNSHNESEVTL